MEKGLGHGGGGHLQELQAAAIDGDRDQLHGSAVQVSAADTDGCNGIGSVEVVSPLHAAEAFPIPQSHLFRREVEFLGHQFRQARGAAAASDEDHCLGSAAV